MAKYPDRPSEPAILWMSGQSGVMRGVTMSNVLTLSVCPSGLRVAIRRGLALAPFCRRFLVPWNELAVIRKTILFYWPVAELRFGSPVAGKLTIPARTANTLARASEGRWPETGPFPQESSREIFISVLLGWGAITSFFALFFTFVLLTVRGPTLAIWLIISVLATFFAAIAAMRFVDRLRAARI
jgi:hypothetical protein